MSVIEPSFAIKIRNGYQTGWRQLALGASLRPQNFGLAWSWSSFDALIKQRQHQEGNGQLGTTQQEEIAEPSRTRHIETEAPAELNKGQWSPVHQKSDCRWTTKGVSLSATIQRGVTSFDTLTLQHERADLYSLRAVFLPRTAACRGSIPHNALRTGRQPVCRTSGHVYTVLPSAWAIIAQTQCAFRSTRQQQRS